MFKESFLNARFSAASAGLGLEGSGGSPQLPRVAASIPALEMGGPRCQDVWGPPRCGFTTWGDPVSCARTSFWGESRHRRAPPLLLPPQKRAEWGGPHAVPPSPLSGFKHQMEEFGVRKGGFVHFVGGPPLFSGGGGSIPAWFRPRRSGVFCCRRCGRRWLCSTPGWQTVGGGRDRPQPRKGSAVTPFWGHKPIAQVRTWGFLGLRGLARGFSHRDLGYFGRSRGAGSRNAPVVGGGKRTLQKHPQNTPGFYLKWRNFLFSTSPGGMRVGGPPQNRCPHKAAVPNGRIRLQFGAGGSVFGGDAGGVAGLLGDPRAPPCVLGGPPAVHAHIYICIYKATP